MQKKYTSLGLMSGTSGDGVDGFDYYSLMETTKYKVIKDVYFEYDKLVFIVSHTSLLRKKFINLAT